MAKKILILEDVDINREMATKALEQEGYEVIATSSGTIGLEKAKNEKPDLIISDLGLEDLTGKKIIEMFKKDLETQSIPILVLSAFVDLKKQFKKDEIIGFIPKPVAPKALIEIVKKILGE